MNEVLSLFFSKRFCVLSLRMRTQHDTTKYARGPMDGLAEAGSEHVFDLGPEYEAAYTTPFWFRFVRLVERRLQQAGIRPNGLADGDLALPTCRYCSLRNEAYVLCPTDGTPRAASTQAQTTVAAGSNTLATPPMRLKYPPNDRGWNAAHQFNMFENVIQCLEVLDQEQCVWYSNAGAATAKAPPVAVSSFPSGTCAHGSESKGTD